MGTMDRCIRAATVFITLSKAFVEAGVQAGYPYRDDFNGGEQEGFGPCDSTIKAVEDKGIRASTAFAYLHPVKERKNLRIITKALATRVIVERGRAVGVEFLRRGRKEVLRAHQEVLLSGGAINSPQLLQLSGIGDPAHLRSLGIEVTAALPGVGQNLHDHLSVGVQCRSTQPNSLLTYIRPVRAAAAWRAICGTREARARITAWKRWPSSKASPI